MNFNFQDRKPIWIALSDFYLDTELSEIDFRFIARKILESPYSFFEVKEINRNEIFPVLISNLLHPAGVCYGFNEDWLITTITNHINNRNEYSKLLEPSYNANKRINEDYWKKLEQYYLELKNQDTRKK